MYVGLQNHCPFARTGDSNSALSAKIKKTKTLYANIQYENWLKLRKTALVEETTVIAILGRLVERHIRDYRL